MPQPLVSVIVPVYNCRDTVARALESVFAQTLPADRIETIAVDDGSTDGGAELLDELAADRERLTVVHQPNSGGAGAPRNRGLERASGEFVFFLDADDRLGPEALERMTAMAERNGTDIVLGKQVGTGGRKVPRVFERTIERTHVLDPDCDLFPRMSMAALQLFRRSLVERAGLRFTEGLLSHEDQLFTAGAYLNARGVSVLADYDCYYWAAREDGSSSTQLGGAPTSDVHAIAGRAMAMVAEHTEPGEIRERLHYRYLLLEVFGLLEKRYLKSAGEERACTLKGCRELMAAWLTPALLERYAPRHRLLAYCLDHHLDAELTELLRFLQRGKRPRVRLDDGHAYFTYPFFRDSSVNIPDACFETGEALRLQCALTAMAWTDGALAIDGELQLRDVEEGAPEVHLVLEGGGRHRVECDVRPVTRTDTGISTSFTASVEPPQGSWPDGQWTVRLEMALEGHTLSVPVTRPRDFDLPPAALVEDGGRPRLVRPLPARGRGELALEAGGAFGPGDVRHVEVAPGPDGRLVVLCEPPPALTARPPSMSLLFQRPGGGEVLRAPLVPEPGRPGRRRADVSWAGARPGGWRASIEIDGVGGPVRVRLPDGGGLVGPLTVSVFPPRRVHVRLGGPLTVHVTAPLTALRRRLRRVRRRLAPGASGDQRNVKEGSE
ncbi:glycosyltransferase family 2 protein [Actinomadura sp. WMMA1423]|uniref:glycosyltransferase family 2 protein n=1 Tax=Actinomadura sp. WMMA1423 TaxID=2591108 RepID=UPI0011477C3F|nr:glycosyltransferase family 2 protein [Actinomadura sp. WMMA1423]